MLAKIPPSLAWIILLVVAGIYATGLKTEAHSATNRHAHVVER